MKLSALFPVLALTLVAQTPDPKPEAKPATVTAAPKPAAKAEAKPEPKKENKIVAIVGTDVIRDSDIDEALQAMPPQQQMQVQMAPNGRQMFIQQYADSRLLSAKARKDGLDRTETYAKRMAQAAQQLAASELLNRDGKELQKKLELKDEDLKAYFEAHKAQFKQADKYSARHILVSIKPATDKDKGVTEEEAKAKILKIQEELKAGKAFEQAVKEYTDDQASKDSGGKYEDFDANRMVPEFANAVRTQEIGKVGAPVKTQYGFHLVEVLKKSPAPEPTFDTSKEQVRGQAGNERRDQVWKEYLDGLRKEIPCVVGDAAAGVAKQLKPEATKAAKPAKPAAKKADKGAAK